MVDGPFDMNEHQILVDGYLLNFCNAVVDLSNWAGHLLYTTC
jgi:hypothetical protein